MSENRNGVKAHLVAFFQVWNPSGGEEAVYHQLVHHGLLAFYEMALRELGQWQHCPKKLQENITHGLRAQVTANIQLARLQDEVVNILRQNHIAFIPLKGSVLSERLYQNALLRSSGDVDILIQNGDYERTMSQLKNNGFKQLDPNKETFYRQRHFHIPLRHEHVPGVLELHWNLSDGRVVFDIPGIFSRTQKIILSDQEVLVMDPTDELLYLMYQHGCHSFLGRKSWILDINQFVKNFGSQIKKDLFLDRMSKWRLKNFVQTSRYYCRKFFSCPEFEQGQVTRLSRWLVDHRHKKWARQFLSLNLIQQSRDQIRFLWRRLG